MFAIPELRGWNNSLIIYAPAHRLLLVLTANFVENKNFSATDGYDFLR